MSSQSGIDKYYDEIYHRDNDNQIERKIAKNDEEDLFVTKNMTKEIR